MTNGTRTRRRRNKANLSPLKPQRRPPTGSAPNKANSRTGRPQGPADLAVPPMRPIVQNEANSGRPVAGVGGAAVQTNPIDGDATWDRVWATGPRGAALDPRPYGLWPAASRCTNEPNSEGPPAGRDASTNKQSQCALHPPERTRIGMARSVAAAGHKRAKQSQSLGPGRRCVTVLAILASKIRQAGRGSWRVFGAPPSGGKTGPTRVKGPQTRNYAFGNPNAELRTAAIRPCKDGHAPSGRPDPLQPLDGTGAGRNTTGFMNA